MTALRLVARIVLPRLVAVMLCAVTVNLARTRGCQAVPVRDMCRDVNLALAELDRVLLAPIR